MTVRKCHRVFPIGVDQKHTTFVPEQLQRQTTKCIVATICVKDDIPTKFQGTITRI